jgi:REP element-mobilizing transposase RayT
MVIASHVIFGAYGFWLPNDPRGSWSEWVGAWELFRYGGPATKVETRQSLAGEPHDDELRVAVKRMLKYPAVDFNDEQRAAVAKGFGRFAEKNGLRILACAILREHVHLVIARHRYNVEQAVLLFKGAATRELAKQDLHPLAAFPRVKERLPTCWSRGEWKVFLNDVDDVERAVGYADANPEKEGLPRQEWEFVQPWRDVIL